jgi:hypothetical protein
MTQSGKPFSASVVIAVCRPSWKRAPVRPTALRIEHQGVRHDVIGFVEAVVRLHPVASFEMLSVGDPSGDIADTARQCAGANGLAKCASAQAALWLPSPVPAN